MSDILDKVEIPVFTQNREVVMMINTFLSAFSVIMMIVALAGGSFDKSSVKNSAWFYQMEGDDIKYHIGLQMVVPEDGNSSMEWTDCTAGVGYCVDCRDAGRTALGCSIVVFIFFIALTAFSALRMTEGSDTGVYKIVAVVSTLITVLFMIIGMGEFDNECIGNMPTTGVSYQLAPGMGCAVTAFFCVCIMMITHLFTAVGPSAAGAPAEKPATSV